MERIVNVLKYGNCKVCGCVCASDREECNFHYKQAYKATESDTEAWRLCLGPVGMDS